MKILIFGAKGNLGEQLVNAYADTPDYNNPLEHNEVIGWDREEIDVTDSALVKKKLADLQPGLVINAVAYNAVDNIEAPEGWELAQKLNVKAVETIAEGCLEIGATLVHYSTDYVFAGDNKSGYDEDAETRPVSKYGLSKRLGEEVLIKLSGKGLKWYLVRTSKLFGPRGSSELVKPSFFDVMLDLAKTKTELEVVDEEVSCFTYTVDLAQATKVLVDQNYGYGIYHIVNVTPVTWYQAAKTLFTIIGKAITVKPVSADKFPRPAKRPKFSILLNTKFIPLRSYEEALREYLNK
jgi:dTDP-4-dehydrorhamnose reductase